MLCACGLLGNVTVLCIQQGWGAFSLSEWARPHFVFVSGAPGVLLAPFFLIAYGVARRHRYRSSALWLAWGAMLFSLLVSIPNGVHAIGWSVQPLIVLLVTCMFGVRPGFAQASVVVILGFAVAFLANLLPQVIDGVEQSTQDSLRAIACWISPAKGSLSGGA